MNRRRRAPAPTFRSPVFPTALVVASLVLGAISMGVGLFENRPTRPGHRGDRVPEPRPTVGILPAPAEFAKTPNAPWRAILQDFVLPDPAETRPAPSNLPPPHGADPVHPAIRYDAALLRDHLRMPGVAGTDFGHELLDRALREPALWLESEHADEVAVLLSEFDRPGTDDFLAGLILDGRLETRLPKLEGRFLAASREPTGDRQLRAVRQLASGSDAAVDALVDAARSRTRPDVRYQALRALECAGHLHRVSADERKEIYAFYDSLGRSR